MLVATLVFLAPQSLIPLRTVVLDLSGWGLNGWQWARDAGVPVGDHDQTALQIATLEEANRRLELHAAHLQERLNELKAWQQGPLAAANAEPLLHHFVQAANVLGQLGVSGNPDRPLVLGLGRDAGIQGDELLAQGTLPVLDQGLVQGLSPDALLLSGQNLWGRVTSAGRWTSTAQPITDAEFRIAVRLVRSSPQGPVFGARGVLRGDGAGCLIEQIPATEPVSVGDHLYTDSSIATPVPLYCGTVAKADLAQGDTFWTVRIIPAAPINTRQLFVFKPQFNPDRFAQGNDAAIVR